MANLFCGAESADESNSNHLVLTEVKLPSLDNQFVDHRAGGAPITIEIDTIVGRLESTFVIAGWTPQISGLFYSWAGADNLFTMYGVVRDRQTGEAQQAIAYMRGKLGRSDPQNYRRGDVFHWNYAIRGITHYELQLADELIYFWDFFTNTFQVGGVNVMAAQNRFLDTGATLGAPVLSGRSPTGGINVNNLGTP
jgi:P2 family phage contractile tail tube protein